MMDIFLFIIICISSIVFSRIILGSWLSPVSAFVSIWGILVILYQFGLSEYLVKLNHSTYILLDVMILSFVLAFALGKTIVFRLSDAKVENDDVISIVLIKRMFVVWLALSAVEVVVSGGIPIVWSLLGSSKTYFDFGIPSLHGFLNGFAQVIACLAFYLIITKCRSKKGAASIIVFIYMYFIMIVTRQVIITLSMELLFIYIFIKKNIKVSQVIAIVMGSTLVFGILGNIRTGYESFIEVSRLNVTIPAAFSGVLWVYMYLVMTLANINNLVLCPDLKIHASTVFSELIPNAISNLFNESSAIQQDRQYMSTLLVTPNYNVSGYFRDYYAWCNIGGVILIASVYGLIGGITYRLYKTSHNERNCILYSISLCIITLSFFFDMLTYLPVSIQFIITILIFYKNKRRFVLRDV